MMNLNQNPTIAQLRKLIADQNDEAGNHMLWVSLDGNVFLEMVPDNQMPATFAAKLDRTMQFRLETLLAGNDYVGPKAAEDDEWVNRVYIALTRNFAQGVKGYVDSF